MLLHSNYCRMCLCARRGKKKGKTRDRVSGFSEALNGSADGNLDEGSSESTWRVHTHYFSLGLR